MSIFYNSKIREIKGCGIKLEATLKEKGIEKVCQILNILPLKYIELKEEVYIKPYDQAFYKVLVDSFAVRGGFYKFKKSSVILKAVVCEQKVKIIFFNLPWIAEQFSKGQEFFIYASFVCKDNVYVATNPKIFWERPKNKLLAFYNSPLRGKYLQKLIKNSLSCLDDKDPLPNKILNKYNYYELKEAFDILHLQIDASLEMINNAKERIIYGEFFFYQLEIEYLRQMLSSKEKNFIYKLEDKDIQFAKSLLSFKLTVDQEKAFLDIIKDLKSSNSMKRLIQGDVGCGKTAVIFLAMALVVKSSYQCALLAPTSILAEQHFTKAKDFFKNFKVALLSSSLGVQEKREVLRKLELGEIDILVGTHAIIEEKVRFKSLALAVIDEQQRFGVAQRTALYCKGKNVELLITTATPIPRTLLLSLYKDIDHSIIKTMPKGRQKIETMIVRKEHRRDFYKELKVKLLSGSKAYIVLPLVEKSDFFPFLAAIEDEGKKIQQFLAPLKGGIICGKTDSLKREEIMKDFKNSKLSFLVSTTVIEVGVDVPDADIIIMESAERYGLSQLHQLRGRVGRGEKQSFCYLLYSEGTKEESIERLKFLSKNSDGFKVAIKDLEIRGAGRISGLEQSGNYDFIHGDINRDKEIMDNAAFDVKQILEEKIESTPAIKDFIKNIRCKKQNISFS